VKYFVTFQYVTTIIGSHYVIFCNTSTVALLTLSRHYRSHENNPLHPVAGFGKTFEIDHQDNQHQQVTETSLKSRKE